MTEISEKTYKTILSLSEKTLTGDWVILGGALLHLLGKNIRTTTDIDLVPISEAGNSSLTQTFELAERAGLEIGVINSAALHFLSKIPNYRDELILLREWKSGKIFRPNLYLFVVLKIERFTESDFLDISAMIEIDLPEKTPKMLKRIAAHIRSKVKILENEKLRQAKKLLNLLA